MIKSMTGFGKGEYSDGKRNFVCEIRSVNHRYADVTVKMPRRYSFLEEVVRKTVKRTVRRGKVEVSIMVDNLTEDDINVRLNTMAAKQYIDNLKELKEEFSLAGEITLEMVAGMPDVLKAIPDVDDEEEITSSAIEAVEAALYNLDQMRLREGQKLGEDLIMRGEIVRKYVD